VLGRVRHFSCTDEGAMGGEFRNTVFVGPKLEEGGGCFISLGLTGDEEEFFAKDEVWREFVKGV
jgi:hypothetical protein